ncbi:hypothetical protein AB1Y20_016763 [Prymnesium parvum]|uniref:HTH La-type RNA-binding domain-containing protein n=1 Tax=Prymnesium parvum TaxID=97485 RepID=A0AB34ID06_PRYPA
MEPSQSAALTRIHSILQHSVLMRSSDIDRVVSQCELLLCDESFCASSPVRSCWMAEGWLPIASFLNYSPLGQIVWPFGGVGVVADCISTRGSHVVELSGDRACIRRKPLRVQLRNQIEYIFSDENYHKDVHLQLLQERDGFTPLQLVVSTYQAVQMLLKHESASRGIELVCEALLSSSELVVRTDAVQQPGEPAPHVPAVRRMTLPEKIKSQVEWYLDADRMAADQFLVEQASDHDGWVLISHLLSFPRMRKLCHPQLSAVAHVLSSSPKLEVSEDKTLVRPLLRPPSSPAHSSVKDHARGDQILTTAERLMGDAHILFDRALHAALAEHSPADALRPGGTGARILLHALLSHPAMKPLRGDLVRALERTGSKILALSEDRKFIERLLPTPEIRRFAPLPLSSDAAATAAAPPPRPPSACDFSVMTYNLLADMLCTIEQFSTVAVEHLDWSNRKALIEAEVKYHMPDILCVQELQGNAAGAGVDDHHAALLAALSSERYASRYLRKVKRNGATWPHAQIGNALFWRTDSFAYVEHVDILIAPLLHAACEDETSAAHFGRGAQVGLAVVLRHLRTNQPLVALTTHLSCNFQEPWTQIAQVHTVLSSAAALAAKYGPRTPVVFGCDLNSIPGSGVYHLVSTGRVAAGHPDLRIIAEQVEMPSHMHEHGTSGGVSQPLAMRSAYATLLGQEPLFTNFTAKFVGTLDYIFYEPNTLQPVEILMLPTEDTVRLEGSLPSSRFPSDHLPLMARFKFTSSPQVNIPVGEAVSGLPSGSESPKRQREALRDGRGRGHRTRPRARHEK